ncbi:putative PLAC8 family protein [Colletotrichum sublineola]|uniref:Putative PLAC8 family protein n=1 Tax=Colletotrichum sublineola TaxID=1173701 RepID=A0A066XKI4_COLSU|nr:putative PLAC8 family protein [Colletotrichum sublineola]
MDYQQQAPMQPQPQPQQEQKQPEQPQHPQQHPQQEFVQGGNIQTQQWQSGLMNCVVGKTSERLRDPTMQTYEAINTDCLLMFGISFFTGCGWVYAMMKRTEIRERFGIRGSGFSDCCVTYWCSCCAVIQHDKEVQARMSTGPITQGYQPQKEGMAMPPQHN